MGQNIVITGASSGIGEHLARTLIKEGHHLFLFARRKERIDAIINGYKDSYGFDGDVASEEAVLSFVDFIKSKTGHIDILINNAGTFGAIGPVIETSSDEWLETFKVNVFGTYLMTKHIVPLMKSNSKIINLSGGGAFNPFENYSAYAVSKSSIVRLTENLAVELRGKGITVNAVAPGFVATELHEKTLQAGKKLAGSEFYQETQDRLENGKSTPVEIPIHCIKFLISDRANGLTGKTISAGFDPWQCDEFSQLVPEINESQLYTLSRINISNLQENSFKEKMSVVQVQSQSIPKR